MINKNWNKIGKLFKALLKILSNWKKYFIKKSYLMPFVKKIFGSLIYNQNNNKKSK